MNSVKVSYRQEKAFYAVVEKLTGKELSQHQSYYWAYKAAERLGYYYAVKVL